MCFQVKAVTMPEEWLLVCCNAKILRGETIRIMFPFDLV